MTYDYPTGDAGRLWRRGVELGQGWCEIGDEKVKIELIGEKNIAKKCQCECTKVYIIRLHDYQHYAKFQCTKCARLRKWAPQHECY